MLLAGMICAGLAACAAPPGPAPEADAAPAAGATAGVVRSLLVQASRAERSGDLRTTESALERALRIEPRNPVLWHYMARLRLAQENYPEAGALAAKSNSLSRGERALQRENWRLISRALALQGDAPGAERAAARAAALAGE